MVLFYFFLAFLIIVGYYLFGKKKLSAKEVVDEHDEKVDAFLAKNILFYKKLKLEDRRKFEQKVYYFLDRVKVTGVNVEINNEEKLLVAAAATIPIFYFDNWFYTNIDEVIIYPSGFNYNFEVGEDYPIQGMVGNRSMNDKMLLSIRALRGGFHNKTDKNNTAIHEFIHLIDMEDGDVDGIPKVFMEDDNVVLWVDLMYKKIKEIREENSDIKAYGATNEAEFLSVASEYFFERPFLFEQKHPELYRILDESFRKN